MNPFRRKVPLPNNESFDATKYPERWVNPSPPTEQSRSDSSVSSSPTPDGSQVGSPSQLTSRSRQLSKQSSFSSIRPLNLRDSPDGRGQQWMDKLMRRHSSGSNIRRLDYKRAFETSQEQSRPRRTSTSLSNIGPKDYNRGEKTPLQLSQRRKNSSFSSIRPVDYIPAPDASSPHLQLRTKPSFSTLEPGPHLHSSAVRTLNYTKPSRKSSFSNIEISPHLNSSAARTINYTTVSDKGQLRRNLSLPNESSPHLHSSSARTIDYAKLSDHDQVRRNPLVSRSQSLDYTRHGRTSGQPSQFASTSSSPTVRALDFTQYSRNREKEIENSRDPSAFSNITMIPEEEYTVYRPNYGK